MSFILDALRKSEHDRQRQTGPGLAEAPIAPAKPKRNVWATAAVALLIVNLIGVGVLLLRRASHEAPAAVPVSAVPAAAPTPAPAAAPVQAPASAPPTAAQASMTQTLPQPVLQPSRAAPASPQGRNPLEGEISGGSPSQEEGMAARAASVPEGPPAVRRTPTSTTIGGNVRYEAIPESTVARAVAAETQAPPPASAQHSGLPNADEVMASGGMPKLHLDLHVYSARPEERFIFVNSHKYREGDTLQEGPVVEQITQNGAVLDYRGSRFLLSRD
jgi:general secretion pathway protein B